MLEQYPTGADKGCSHDQLDGPTPLVSEELTNRQLIPGYNPLGLTEIDFQNQAAVTIAPIFHFGLKNIKERYWSPEYYEISTCPLRMDVLHSHFYTYFDLFVRGVATRNFQTKERTIYSNTSNLGTVNSTQENVESAVRNNVITVAQTDPDKSRRYYVNNFSFGEVPQLVDFDLSEWRGHGRNNEALGLLAYRMIEERANIQELLGMYNDLGPIYSNLPEKDFYQKLLNGFQVLFRPDIQFNMGPQGMELLNEQNREDILSRAADWMAYCALELTSKTGDKRAVVNDPYPTALLNNSSRDREYPDIDVLPHLIRAFEVYFECLPAYVNRGQPMVPDVLRQAYKNLDSFITEVCTVKNHKIETDDPIFVALASVYKKANNLLQNVNTYFANVDKPIETEEAVRSLLARVFDEPKTE